MSLLDMNWAASTAAPFFVRARGSGEVLPIHQNAVIAAHHRLLPLVIRHPGSLVHLLLQVSGYLYARDGSVPVRVRTARKTFQKVQRQKAHTGFLVDPCDLISPARAYHQNVAKRPGRPRDDSTRTEK